MMVATFRWLDEHNINKIIAFLRMSVSQTKGWAELALVQHLKWSILQAGMWCKWSWVRFQPHPSLFYRRVVEKMEPVAIDIALLLFYVEPITVTIPRNVE